METDLSEMFRSLSAGPAFGASTQSAAGGGPASNSAAGRTPNRPQDNSTLYTTGNGMSSCTLFPRTRGNQFFTRAVPLARLHGPTTEPTPHIQMARIRGSLRNVDTLLNHLAASTPPELYSVTLPAVADPSRHDIAEFDPAVVDQIAALSRLTEEVAQMEVRVAEALREGVTALRPGAIDGNVQRPREHLRRCAIITGNVSYRMSQIHLLLTPLIMNLQFTDEDTGRASGIVVPSAELPRRLRLHASSAHASHPDTLFGSATSVSGSHNSGTRRSRAGPSHSGAPAGAGHNVGTSVGSGSSSSVLASASGTGSTTAARPASTLSNLAGGGRSSSRSGQPAVTAPSQNRAGPSLISMELSVGIGDGPLSGSSRQQSTASTTSGEARGQQERGLGEATSASSASGRQRRGSSASDGHSHQAVFHFMIHPPQLHFMSTPRNAASASRATSQAPVNQPTGPSTSTPTGNSESSESAQPFSPGRVPSPTRSAPTASPDEFPYIPRNLRFSDLIARGGDGGGESVPHVPNDSIIRSFAELHSMNGDSNSIDLGGSEGSAAAATAMPEATVGIGAAADTAVSDGAHPPFRWPHPATTAASSQSGESQPLIASRDPNCVPGSAIGDAPRPAPTASESGSSGSRKRRRGMPEDETGGAADEAKRRRY